MKVLGLLSSSWWNLQLSPSGHGSVQSLGCGEHLLPEGLAHSRDVSVTFGWLPETGAIERELGVPAAPLGALGVVLKNSVALAALL